MLPIINLIQQYVTQIVSTDGKQFFNGMLSLFWGLNFILI